MYIVHDDHQGEHRDDGEVQVRTGFRVWRVWKLLEIHGLESIDVAVTRCLISN